MKADIRDYLDTAISDLLDAGEITVSPGVSGTRKVHMYHRYMDEKQPLSRPNGECTDSTYVPTPLELIRQRPDRQRHRTRGRNRIDQQTCEDVS